MLHLKIQILSQHGIPYSIYFSLTKVNETLANFMLTLPATTSRLLVFVKHEHGALLCTLFK